MFIKLTCRFGFRGMEGKKFLINFDKVVSVKEDPKGAVLEMETDKSDFRQFLSVETQDEIYAQLARGHSE